MDSELRSDFEIDDEIEPGGLHDRQVSGYFTLEDARDIDTRLSPRLRQVRTVAEQASVSDIYVSYANGWYAGSKSLFDVQIAAAESEQRIGAGQECSDFQLAHRRESFIELALAGDIHHMQRQSQRLGC